MSVGIVVNLVTISLDTLSDSALTFVRDVLRNNLTDKKIPARSGSNWVFKSHLDTTEVDLPHVVVTESREEMNRLTLGNKIGIPSIRLDIRVWALEIQHRDQISDEIVKILKDKDSADSDGTSLIENRLIFKRAEKFEEDGFIADNPKLFRIKRVMVDFKYIGG